MKFNYLKINASARRGIEGHEEGLFSIVDVVGVLTESDYQSARNYWKVTKMRLKEEGNQSVTNCNQLKMMSSDGKRYNTDVANAEQLLRIIHPFHHPKPSRSSSGSRVSAANALTKPLIA